MTALRIAATSDGEAIAGIYNPIIRDSAISLETECLPASAIVQRLSTVLATYPWLVATRQGTVVGYAYAGAHHERAGYRWSANVSVYVAEGARRSGVASQLYLALEAILRLQGLHRLFAGITLPNPASVALHEAFGYRLVGVYDRVGHKQGQWHSVGWWGLSLVDDDAAPAEIVPFPRLRDEARVRAILTAAGG